MITLHHLAVSQSERIVWLMEELGLPYRLEWYSRKANRLAPDEYLALHPTAMAPVIEDDGRVLTESAVIVEYLCHRHAGGRFTVRPEQPNYYDYLYWMHFNNGLMGLRFTRSVLGAGASAERRRVCEADRAAHGLPQGDGDRRPARTRRRRGAWLRGRQTLIVSATAPDNAPRLFKSAKAFEAWLKRHHARSDGLWLQIAKRGADEPSVTYPEAVEIALCWGWIDGQKKGLDDQHFLQRFTPRRARSIWSKINIDKVAALTEAGRMQPPGLAQVEAAQADGRWAQAYDGARTSTVPDDLQAALEAEPKAQAFFATISAANRYAVLWRIQTAVKAETRARRIAQLVAMLARGETVHVDKPKAKP